VPRYRFTTIAETGERFADFRPYVASIDDAGSVSFAASLAGGGSGIFAGSGDPPQALFTGPVSSHPDGAAGSVWFYGSLADGRQAVVRAGDGAVDTVAAAGDELAAIGPLGPTVNGGGTVAFRADLASGAAGIFAVAPGISPRVVATAGDRFARFEGLPLVDGAGAVVFRAAAAAGEELICREAEPVVDSRGRFASLGRFPALTADGGVLFAAALRSGGAGVFVARGGQVETAVAPVPRFASVRGALADGRGVAVFYATPVGGELGIYAAAEPGGPPIVAVGGRLCGAQVTAFALNPVSINRRGQLAIRIELAGGRQAIVRADPVD
jgi:hypothetical protein